MITPDRTVSVRLEGHNGIMNRRNFAKYDSWLPCCAAAVDDDQQADSPDVAEVDNSYTEASHRYRQTIGAKCSQSGERYQNMHLLDCIQTKHGPFHVSQAGPNALCCW